MLNPHFLLVSHTLPWEHWVGLKRRRWWKPFPSTDISFQNVAVLKKCLNSACFLYLIRTFWQNSLHLHFHSIRGYWLLKQKGMFTIFLPLSWTSNKNNEDASEARVHELRFSDMLLTSLQAQARLAVLLLLLRSANKTDGCQFMQMWAGTTVNKHSWDEYISQVSPH